MVSINSSKISRDSNRKKIFNEPKDFRDKKIAKVLIF
jgi:hypothetical protein